MLILTAVLLRLGVALAFLGELGMRSANRAIAGQADDRARIAASAVESLIARNVLSLRIAANAALASGPADACERMRGSLAIAPGVAQQFELGAPDGTPFCSIGEIPDVGDLDALAPGAIQVRSCERRCAVVRAASSAAWHCGDPSNEIAMRRSISKRASLLGLKTASGG